MQRSCRVFVCGSRFVQPAGCTKREPQNTGVLTRYALSSVKRLANKFPISRRHMRRTMALRAFALRDFRYDGSVSWFPGHMAKANQEIAKRLKDVDVVLELRDARVPLSSTNNLLQQTLRDKPRLVVLNKADLVNPNMQRKIRQKIAEDENVPAVFTVAYQNKNVDKIMAWAKTHVRQVSAVTAGAPLFMMVVGVPNVGKSSLINALTVKYGQGLESKKRKKAKVGSLPGVTRHQQKVRVSAQPPLYLVDTPGVMVPHLTQSPNDVEQGLRLAITGAISAKIVGEEILVDYLLHWLSANFLDTKGGRRTVQKFLDALPISDIEPRVLGSGEGVAFAFAADEGGGSDNGGDASTSTSTSTSMRMGYSANGEDGEGSEVLTFRKLLRSCELIRMSGAAGKPQAERERRVAKFVLDKFRKGDLGWFTLDLLT